MSTYPSNILVKGDVINDVDVYDQNDHNILKGEIIALQTNIGTSPQGTQSNFMARYNAMHNGSGYLISSAGTPQPTAPGFLWYDTTAGILKFIKTDNTQQSVGGSLSNLLFFKGAAVRTDSSDGFWQTINLNDGGTIRLSKISGMNTLVFIGEVVGSNAANNQISLGVSGSTTVSSTFGATPAEITLTHDISGVANGTIYPITFQVFRTGGTAGIAIRDTSIFAE